MAKTIISIVNVISLVMVIMNTASTGKDLYYKYDSYRYASCNNLGYGIQPIEEQREVKAISEKFESLLKSGEIEKFLKEREATSRKLTEREMWNYKKLDKHHCLESNCWRYKNSENTNEEWYMVKLFDSEEDIMLKRYIKEEDIYQYSYFSASRDLDNKLSYCKSFYAYGHSGEEYFFNWEGNTYLAIPMLDKEKNIKGISIYVHIDYQYIGFIVSMEKNKNGEILKEYYGYATIGTANGNAATLKVWPAILDREQKEHNTNK